MKSFNFLLPVRRVNAFLELGGGMSRNLFGSIFSACVFLSYLMASQFVLLADSKKEQFLEFCSEVVSQRIDEYQRLSYEVYEETAFTGGSYSSIQIARIGAGGLLLRKSGSLGKPEFGSFLQPPAYDESALDLILIGNSRYQAEISRKSGSNIVSNLRNRNTDEKIDIATEACFGIPYIGAFETLARLEKTVVSKWTAEGSSMVLVMDVFGVSPRVGQNSPADIHIVASIEPASGLCIKHHFDRKFADGTKDDFHTVIEYDNSPTPFPTKIESQQSITNYRTRTLFRRLPQSDLTEAECTLSAFGLPEPAEYGPRNYFAIWVMGIGFLVCMFAFFVGRRRKLAN